MDAIIERVRNKMAGYQSQSGFGPLEPIKYISRELGITIINNALDLGSEERARELWDAWTDSGNIMPADKFGQHLFFHQNP